MRFLIRPLHDPDAMLDLTDAVVDAIARRLASTCGGNDVLNRLEAASHLESLLRRSMGQQVLTSHHQSIRDVEATIGGASPAPTASVGKLDDRNDSNPSVRQRQPKSPALQGADA